MKQCIAHVVFITPELIIATYADGRSRGSVRWAPEGFRLIALRIAVLELAFSSLDWSLLTFCHSLLLDRNRTFLSGPQPSQAIVLASIPHVTGISDHT